MVNENIKLIAENKKPVETVCELKNEVPSFEEFMKTYEANGKVNYDDLIFSDIGEVKGYGPNPDGCGKECETVITNSDGHVYTSIGLVRFHLRVECYNWHGSGGTFYTDYVKGALQHAHRLEDGLYSNVSSEVERKCATLIREAVRHYDRGNKVVGHIRVQGKFWGGYEWDTGY